MRFASAARLKDRTREAYRENLPEEAVDDAEILANFASNLPFSQLYYRLVSPTCPQLERLPNRCRAHIEMIWHHELMILTGRLWGLRMRNYYRRKQAAENG